MSFPAQHSRCAVDNEISMDAPVRVSRVAAVEESGDAVALQSSVVNFFSQNEVATSDGVGPELRLSSEDSPDFVAKGLGDALIGVDDQHPVVGRSVHGVVFLRGRAE